MAPSLASAAAAEVARCSAAAAAAAAATSIPVAIRATGATTCAAAAKLPPAAASVSTRPASPRTLALRAGTTSPAAAPTPCCAAAAVPSRSVAAAAALPSRPAATAAVLRSPPVAGAAALLSLPVAAATARRPHPVAAAALPPHRVAAAAPTSHLVAAVFPADTAVYPAPPPDSRIPSLPPGREFFARGTVGFSTPAASSFRPVAAVAAPFLACAPAALSLPPATVTVAATVPLLRLPRDSILLHTVAASASLCGHCVELLRAKRVRLRSRSAWRCTSATARAAAAFRLPAAAERHRCVCPTVASDGAQSCGGSAATAAARVSSAAAVCVAIERSHVRDGPAPAGAAVNRRFFFSQRSAALKVPRYQRIYAMTAKELRHAVADAARRQLRMHELWDAFLYRACVLRSELTPEQVASLFQSLAAVDKPLISFMDFILEDVRRRNIHRFRLQDASLLLAGLSRLKGARDPLLLHALLPVLLRRLRCPAALPEPQQTGGSSSSSSAAAEDRGRSAASCISRHTSKNQLSALKYVALLAHAYVKLKGPQTELLLSSVAARLAAPGLPLLPPLQKYGGRVVTGMMPFDSDRLSSRGRKNNSGSGSPVKKKKSKIHVPQSLVLLLGAFAAHARTVCQRAAAVADARAAAAAAAFPAVSDAADSERNGVVDGGRAEEGREEENIQQQQIPFASVLEALLERGLLQLSDFSPRDCTCFLKAVADLAACDQSIRRMVAANSSPSRSRDGWRDGSSSSQEAQSPGLLLLGGVVGLRGILDNMYRRLLRLRFDLKSSDCLLLLTSVWPLEQLLAAAPAAAHLPCGGYGGGAAASCAAAVAAQVSDSERAGYGRRPPRYQREGDAHISHLLLQELLFRAADLPAAAVLDTMRVLLDRRQQSACENGGSKPEVYPALEAALLSRLGTVMTSLFYSPPGSADAKRRSLAATPAAVADLLRQMCAPRAQPYLPPSFAPPTAWQGACRSQSPTNQACTLQAAAVAAHYVHPAAAASFPAEGKKPPTAGPAAAVTRRAFEGSAETTPAGASVAAAQAVLAAEAAAAQATRQAGGGTGSSIEKVEPMYCLSTAAAACVQSLLASLAATGDVKRLLNLQETATLCWTCAALRVRDPLLERLLLKHRNSVFLALAATGAAAAAQTSVAAGEREAVVLSDVTGTNCIVAEEVWTAAAAATDGIAGDAGKAAPAETHGKGSAVVSQGRPSAAQREICAVTACGTGAPRGLHVAAEVEAAADEDEDVKMEEVAAELGAAEEGGVAFFEEDPVLIQTEAEEETAAAPTLAEAGGAPKKEAGTSAALATLAAGLAHLGMADVADALAVFPLLATIENFTQMETALTVLVAAAVFDLTRRPRTLASSLLCPAATTVYQQRAALLPSHYVSLTFIASSSIPDAFPAYIREFFRRAWHFCSPLHPLHCSKAAFAPAVGETAAPEAVSAAPKREHTFSSAVTATAERESNPAGGLTDWRRASSSAAAAGADTSGHAIYILAPPFSSAGSISPHLFATLVRAAPHRCRASTADLLRAVCKRGVSHEPSSSPTTNDVSKPLEGSQWREKLLRMQPEKLAEQLLYCPSDAPRGGDLRVAAGLLGQHEADVALSEATTGTGDAETQPELDEDGKNADMAPAVTGGAPLSADVRGVRGGPQQTVHDCRPVRPFPERVRHHFRTEWRGIQVHSEIFIPACSRCLPFAIELQSISHHVTALAEADPSAVVASANDAVRDIVCGVSAGASVAGSETTVAERAAAPPETRDYTISTSICRRDRFAGKAYNYEADFLNRTEVYRGRTPKKGSAYLRGGGVKRHSLHEFACESHPATSRRTAAMRMREEHAMQKEHGCDKEGQQAHGERGGYSQQDSNVQQMRKRQHQKPLRAPTFHVRRGMKRETEMTGRNCSTSGARNRRCTIAIRKKKRVTADGCGGGTSSQRSRSRHWSKSQDGRASMSRDVTVGSQGFRSKCDSHIQSPLVAGGELADKEGTAWALIDCVVIRKETHALVELLWNDFDFLRGLPERKVNMAALSHTDTRERQRRPSPPLCPGKVAELNALKKQGWTVFCLSETTWRSIENANVNGRKKEELLKAELKLYVIQCIAALQARMPQQRTQQRQHHRQQQ